MILEKKVIGTEKSIKKNFTITPVNNIVITGSPSQQGNRPVEAIFYMIGPSIVTGSVLPNELLTSVFYSAAGRFLLYTMILAGPLFQYIKPL